MTIKDIAAEAGVSPAAVSRYFNGGSLSEEKLKRIEEVVNKHNYVPNKTAHTMRTGKSGNIGVLVPKIHSDSLSNIMHGIADGLANLDYTLILGVTDGLLEKEVHYINTMQNGGIDGIILMANAMNPYLKSAIDKCSVPIVITGQSFEGMPCVYYDDYNAMRELTKLMTKKRKNIAYIGAPEYDPAVGGERKNGVMSVLSESGVDTDKVPYVASEGFRMDNGYDAMLKLLKGNKKIDGVICATDSLAVGAMTALKEKGYKLPKDVSIAGIGNSLAGKVVEPKLTTVRLFFEQCGQTAAKLLVDMINSDRSNFPISQIKLGYEIIERGSI